LDFELRQTNLKTVTSDELSEVAIFLARFVSTVEQMEILCLFSKDSAKKWSVTEVFRAIQSSTASVSQCLELFVKQELLLREGEGLYRFGPGSEEVAKGAMQATRAYRELPVKVIAMIYSQPPDAIRDFAEAFRLKKKE
jgi:hypothetical protein